MTETLFERYKEALRAGHVAVLRGRLEDAAVAYREAISITADRAVPRTALGGVQLRLGDPAGALDAFDGALALDPDDDASLGGRAQALVVLRRTAEAAVVYDHLADVASRARTDPRCRRGGPQGARHRADRRAAPAHARLVEDDRAAGAAAVGASARGAGRHGGRAGRGAGRSRRRGRRRRGGHRRPSRRRTRRRSSWRSRRRPHGATPRVPRWRRWPRRAPTGRTAGWPQPSTRACWGSASAPATWISTCSSPTWRSITAGRARPATPTSSCCASRISTGTPPRPTSCGAPRPIGCPRIRASLSAEPG